MGFRDRFTCRRGLFLSSFPLLVVGPGFIGSRLCKGTVETIIKVSSGRQPRFSFPLSTDFLFTKSSILILTTLVETRTEKKDGEGLG